MATELHVSGPFEIGFDSKGTVKRITREHAVDFWKPAFLAHLRDKHGCYIFAVRAGKGSTPWYVGQSATGFAKETFTDHKLAHYNDALFKTEKGTPVIFFVAPPATKKVVPAEELNHMEKELIQDALAKNPDLRNVQNTKNLPQWSIKGVVRSERGKPTIAARKFKKMMGL